MAVTSATGSQAAGQDIGALGKAQLASSYDTFMKLLTTQIQNQDPLSPLDSNQFTQQLVQMTGVQQQLYSNDLLKQLVGNTGTGMSQAVSVLGREVSADSPTTGLAGGEATWAYNLGRDAASVKVEVVDANGRTLAVASPSGVSAGDHTFTWSGTDLTGLKRPDGGEYTLRITPMDASGATINSRVFQRGVVTGVEQVDGKPVLSIGGARVPWTAVTSVRQPA